MELQPGWVWEDYSEGNSMELAIISADDLNNDGFNDAITYTKVERQDSDNIGDPDDIPNYGKIIGLDGLTGLPLWEKDCENPVKKVFELADINGDGIKDYLADIATVGPDWVIQNPTDLRPEIIIDEYTNVIISGNNGSEIPILTGDFRSFTNFFIQDAVYLSESRADLVFLECNSKGNETTEFFFNISSYFTNGTQFDTFNIGFGWIDGGGKIPALKLFPYGSKDELLFIDNNRIILFNTSVDGFMNPIFNETITEENRDYTFIEDLDGDGISEIAVMNFEGKLSIISSINGSTIRTLNMPTEYDRFDVNQLGSDENDQSAYILVNCEKDDYDSDIRESLMLVYTVTESSDDIFWSLTAQTSQDTTKAFVLGEDMDDDGIDEIVLSERIELVYSTTEVRRYSILSTPDNIILSVINNEYGVQSILPLQDLNGDGKSDNIFSSYNKSVAFASSKPLAIWASPHFPFGIPLLAILVAFLCIGILLIILKSRKLNYTKGGIKEHKLTVIVNVLAITLISLTFLLFLIQINIFNRTLIPNQNMTLITVSFLIVIITWYGALPLTAAIYNRFAAGFAYMFIKLRSLFFKISKSYNTDILVLDMKDRKEIGTVIRMKRILLPLLLSIAIGFYTYGALTPILGYPQDFEVFGSTEFFQFMNGYMLCCIFPMILTFIVFSFFISGNFLLDDAGIVYFRQSRKHRQPGDIEPISVWAQSLV